MKKYLLMLATAVVALGFASCSNEEEDETPAPKSEIKLNISVSNLDGSNDVNSGVRTKAAKAGWENGDKINIWFYGSHSTDPEAIIVYNGSSWNLDGAISEETLTRLSSYTGNKKMVFLYENRNDLNHYKKRYSEIYNEIAYSCETGTETDYYSMPMIYGPDTWAEDSDNSFNLTDGTLTLKINKWEPITQFQVVVGGLEPTEAENYVLGISGMTGNNSLDAKEEFYSQFNDYKISIGGNNSSKNLGMSNADGVAFYFRLINGNYNGDITFSLYDTSGNNIGSSYTVTNKSLEQRKMTNVKIDKSKFGL